MGLGGERPPVLLVSPPSTLGYPGYPAIGPAISLYWKTFPQQLVPYPIAYRAERTLTIFDPGAGSRPGVSLDQGVEMSQSVSLSSQNRYEIKFFGQLDDSWYDWFEGGIVQTEILSDDRLTTKVTEVVMDQAGIVGLIRRLHGFGIVLISIRQM